MILSPGRKVSFFFLCLVWVSSGLNRFGFVLGLFGPFSFFFWVVLSFNLLLFPTPYFWEKLNPKRLILLDRL